MRFLLKIFILLLAFQTAFGRSYYQRRKAIQRKKAAAIREANRQLRAFCNIEQNFDELQCVTLRAQDAAAEEARRLAVEKHAALKVFCETNNYDSKCIHEFGLPQPWNYILYACILVIPTYIVFGVLS